MTDEGQPPTIERLALETTDGLALRAEIASVDGSLDAAVLCHPHPLHGGNMFASVIDALFRHLPTLGMTAVRFNFRGVDGSDGRHDYGQGERLDVVAGLELAAARTGSERILLAGWSFGADVALNVAHPLIGAWLAVAPPLRLEPWVASHDRRSKVLVVPAHDQFCPPERAATITSDWEATSMRVAAGADHFLAGAMGEVREAADAACAAVATRA